ncbi:MAG: DUF5606 domain-containing protein [Bacteroidetes bacterium]|nr:DUF5606 domain-containing protein [Bacteroidota bacterium]
MDLSKIMAISGKPGLYKSIANTKNGIIVESIIDGKRFTAFAHERVSSLEEISVFTTGEDLSLKDVLKRIFDKQQGQKAIDIKADTKALLSFFEEVVPEYDKERVYTSDIKKVINWYNLLQGKNMLDFTEEEKKEETTKEEGTEEKKEETTN